MVTEPGLNIQRKDMMNVADIQRQETVSVRCNVRGSAGKRDQDARLGLKGKRTAVSVT